MQEGISGTIVLARPVLYGIVVVCQEVHPPELSSVQYSGSHKVLEVLVVHQDFNQDLGAF